MKAADEARSWFSAIKGRQPDFKEPEIMSQVRLGLADIILCEARANRDVMGAKPAMQNVALEDAIKAAIKDYKSKKPDVAGAP